MSSAIRTLGVLLLCCASPLFAAVTELRVCADPNNLPYSNQQQQGFENELGATGGPGCRHDAVLLLVSPTAQVLP